MSQDFIKKKPNKKYIEDARRQQKHLSYLTESKIQDSTTIQYYQHISCGLDFNYDDPFLAWVNALFKADNFKSFFKYTRFPAPSARLVKEEMVPHLERVFFAEDSFFRYAIGGESQTVPLELDSEEFNKIMFNALLYRYNDILVHDLSDVNTPVRYLVSINKVIAIDSENGKINRIAYHAIIPNPDNEDKELSGYLYLDDEAYIFYDKEKETELFRWPHDLGECPADYVSAHAFNSESDVLRDSIFSRVRTDLEEYLFLKTIQKMSEPNGAIPITTKFKQSSKNKEVDEKREVAEPMSVAALKGDKAKKENTTEGALQAGTIYELPMNKDESGKIQTDLIENFIHFHRIPTDSLEYINTRVKEIEELCISTVIGDYKEQNREEAKNELQISKSYDQRQDKIRRLAYQMTKLRTNSDRKFLGLQHGPDRVAVDINFGTDFFIETQDDLYYLFEKAPNPIERSTILQRLAQRRGMFNKKRADKDVIMYKLMPYASDKDFNSAIASNIVGPTDMQKQLRLSYWLSIFESTYGDLVEFWMMFEDTEESRILQIVNELLNQIIIENGEEPIKPQEGDE